MAEIKNREKTIIAGMDLARYELKSAQILFDAGQYRDSITHSYYAMYQAASSLLLKKDYTTKTHEGLIKVFGREFVRDDDFSTEIFGFLTKASSLRNDTSYDVLAIFNEEDAEKCISNAESFIMEVERFL